MSTTIQNSSFSTLAMYYIIPNGPCSLQLTQPIPHSNSSVWPFSSFTSPVDAFHTHTELLAKPDTIHVLSLEIKTEQTELVKFSCFSSTPVEASHTHTDLSYEPDTICVPSLENMTEMTVPVWPFSSFSSHPLMHPHTHSFV